MANEITWDDEAVAGIAWDEPAPPKAAAAAAATAAPSPTDGITWDEPAQPESGLTGWGRRGLAASMAGTDVGGHLGGLWERNAGSMVEGAGGSARFVGEAGTEFMRGLTAPVSALLGVASQQGRITPEQAQAGRIAAMQTLPTEALARVGTELADQGRAQQQAGEAASHVPRPESLRADPIGAIKYFANQAAGSAVPLALSTLQPEIGLSIMGGQSFGAEYDKRRNEGRSIGGAAESGALHAAAEVLPERLSLNILRGQLGAGLTKLVGERAAKSVTDNLASRVVAGAAAEGGSEVVTQAIQDLHDKYVNGDATTGEQILRNLVDAFGTGVAMGGPLAGAHAALTNGSDLMQGGAAPAAPPVAAAPTAPPAVLPPDPAALAPEPGLQSPAAMNAELSQRVAAAFPEEAASPAGRSDTELQALADRGDAAQFTREEAARIGGAPAPARPRFDPDARLAANEDAEIQTLVTEDGLTDEQARRVRARLVRPVERDRVTGMYRSEELDRTIQSVQDADEPGLYIEADFANLGGANAAMGTSSADRLLKEFAETVNTELGGVADAQVVPIRKGGDEFAFVVTGAPRSVVEPAMERARTRFTESMAAAGHGNIPHPKGGAPGVGFNYGISDIVAGAKIGDILKAADTQVEARKKGAPYVVRETAEALGPGGDAGSGAVASAGAGAGRIAAPIAGSAPAVARAEPGAGGGVRSEGGGAAAVAAPAAPAPAVEPRQRRSSAPARVDSAAVRSTVDAVSKSWRNAPQIDVFDSPADAPVKLDDDAAGAYANGRVMLFARNIRDAAHAQFVLLHETLGHHGLLGTLGPKLRPVMRTIYATNPGVRARAQEWMRENDSRDEELATEEALADMAATDIVKLSGWKRLVAAIRDALRRAGFTLDMSDADIAALLTRARAQVEGDGSTGARGAGTKYSKSSLNEIRSGVGDDLVTLYHGTNKDGFDAISRDGVITTGSYYGIPGDGRGVALTPRREVALDYGDGEHVFEVRIPRDRLVVDLESYDNPDVDEALSRGRSVYATGDIRLGDDAKKYSKRRDQTETPEFKRWFGDSKVVDANGEPLVVYHATPADFSSFKRTRGADFGFHFGSSEQANGRIEGRRIGDAKTSEKSGAYSVMPVFLSIKNPLRVPDAGYFDGSNSVFVDDLRDRGVPIRSNPSHPEITRALEAKGYDGLVYENEGGNEAAGDSYVALRPEQIKSATGNTGAFDPSNPDIRYSKAAAKSLGVTPPAPAVQNGFDGYTLPTEQFRAAYAEMQGNALRKFYAGLKASGRALKRSAVDTLYPLQTAEKAVQQLGTYAPDVMNTYQRAELFHGRAGQRIRDFWNERAKPLVEDIAASKVSLEDLDNFLYANFAPRRNEIIRNLHKGKKTEAQFADGGSGMTDAEADKIMAEFRQRGVYDELSKFADRVYAMNAERIDTLQSSGLMSQEEADEWRAEPHYVPLRGFADDRYIAFNRAPSSGKGFSVGGKESPMAHGRLSRAASPLGNVIAQASLAYVRAEKNAVAQSLLATVIANPNKKLWEVARIKAKPIRDPDTGEIVEDKDGGKVFQFERPSDRSPEIFNVKVDGKTYAVRFIGREGEMLAAGLKNLGSTQLGWFMQKLRTVGRYVSLLRTSWNPEFMFANFARDIQTALANLSVEQRMAFARKVAKTIPAALSAGFRREAGVREHPRLGQYYQDFLRDGGRTDYANLREVEEIAGDVASLLKNQKRSGYNPIRIAKRAWELFEAMNTAVENASRLAAYVVAREEGISRPDSASIAKNLTVNFNRHGTAGPWVNSLYNFANASVQGNARYAQFLARNPKAAMKRVVAPLALLGFATSVLNGFSGGDDDDGEERWSKVPDFERDRNFILMVGKHKIKIPMPYTYNLPFVAGSRIADVVMGRAKSSTVLEAIAKASLNSLNPLGDSPTLAGYIAPTLVDPFVEVETNKDFTGRPIRPENPYDKTPDPDSQKSFERTPEPYKWLAEGLNTATGGSSVRSGKIDVSPTTFQHAVNFALGGVGSFLGRAWNSTAGAAIKGEAPAARDVPFLRTYYGRADDTQVRTDYWTWSGDARKRVEEAKLADAEGRTQGASEDLLREWEVADTLKAALKQSDRELSRLRDDRKEAKAAGDAAAEKAADKAIRDVQAEFNRQYVEALRSIDEPLR